MNEVPDNSAGRADPIAAAAARWVMRQDRGLSPAEQDRYLQWLTADPRHRAAMAVQRSAWEAFDRLAGLQRAAEAEPDPDLLLPRKRRERPRALRPMVAAVALGALAIVGWWQLQSPSVAPRRTAGASDFRLPPIEERVLEDGSRIRLNRGAQLAVEYSPAERRVRLEQGEAAFEVVRDAARPFVVATGGVSVRAVGTAFNVRRDPHAVEVIVTEGRVAVAGAPEAETAPIVDAGQQAVVILGATVATPVVSTPAPEEMARRLAWQPRLLSFADEELGVILEAFNRHNPIVLRIEEPALREMRLSARFRSDNIQGFLRLLESDFRVEVRREAGGKILLRSVRPPR